MAEDIILDFSKNSKMAVMILRFVFYINASKFSLVLHSFFMSFPLCPLFNDSEHILPIREPCNRCAMVQVKYLFELYYLKPLWL